MGAGAKNTSKSNKKTFSKSADRWVLSSKIKTESGSLGLLSGSNKPVLSVFVSI